MTRLIDIAEKHRTMLWSSEVHALDMAKALMETRGRAFYGSGGALVSDHAIAGVTQEISGETAFYYGGFYFIGESMSRGAANVLAEALGLEMSDRPFSVPGVDGGA